MLHIELLYQDLHDSFSCFRHWRLSMRFFTPPPTTPPSVTIVGEEGTSRLFLFVYLSVCQSDRLYISLSLPQLLRYRYVINPSPGSGRPTILITVGQGHTALAVGAGGGCLDIFTLLYHFSPLSPILWETEILSQRAVKPKTTNQPHPVFNESCCTSYLRCVQMKICMWQFEIGNNNILLSLVISRTSYHLV